MDVLLKLRRLGSFPFGYCKLPCFVRAWRIAIHSVDDARKERIKIEQRGSTLDDHRAIAIANSTGMTSRARQTDPTPTRGFVVMNGEADRQLILIGIRNKTEPFKVAAERFAPVLGPQA